MSADPLAAPSHPAPLASPPTPTTTGPGHMVEPGGGLATPPRTGSQNSSRWLGLHRPAARVRARLVVIPFAGGNASAFFPFTRSVGAEDWLDVAVVQPPGRASRLREAPVASLEQYADGVSALCDHFNAGGTPVPTFLLGYSMGALVAYLTAKRGHASDSLAGLLLAARKAPTPRTLDTQPRAPMSRQAVLERLRHLQGTPEQVLANPDLINPYLDSIAHEFHLIDNWAAPHLPPVSTDISVLCGMNDPETPIPSALAWRGLTTGGFVAHLLPGGHFFLNTAENEFCRLVRQTVSTKIGGTVR